MDVHFRVDKDVKIDVYVIGPTPASDLMALFYSFNGEDQLFDLLDLNRHPIAEHPGALPQNIHGSISDEGRNNQRGYGIKNGIP